MINRKIWIFIGRLKVSYYKEKSEISISLKLYNVEKAESYTQCPQYYIAQK